MNSIEKNQQYLKRFFVIVFIVCLLLLLTTIVVSFLSLYLFKVDISSTGFDQKNDILFLKILQVISMVGIFGLSPLIVAKYFNLAGKKVYHLTKFPSLKQIAVTVVIFVSVLPVLQWLIVFNESMHLPEVFSALEQWMRSLEDKMAEQMNTFLEMEKYSDFFVNIFVIAIVPAFFEELFFRGLIQSYLTEWLNKKHLSVLLTAFLFSAVHFQFFGFIPRLFLGLILGYLFVFTRNLWVPILFHFINNFLSIVIVFLQNKNIINDEFENSMSESYLFVIISLAIVAALFLYFAFYFDKRRDKSKDWIKVHQTSNEKEAEIIQGKLENQDIVASIINKRDSSFLSFGSIEIYVQPQNVEMAKQIIDEEINVE